jgi:phosphoglycerol transferase
MALATFLSLLLVISGLAVCVRSGRSKALSGLLAFEALACLFLLIGYALADHFTGEGINSAVWYHVRYGLRGAGFQDYRGVMVATVLALLFALVAVVALIRWRRHEPRRVSALVVGQLLLISAWITNPAIKDLIALSRTHSPATADFYRHEQPASLT